MSRMNQIKRRSNRIKWIKSNRIKSNRIKWIESNESNQMNQIKSNQIKSNRMNQIKSNRIKSNQIVSNRSIIDSPWVNEREKGTMPTTATDMREIQWRGRWMREKERERKRVKKKWVKSAYLLFLLISRIMLFNIESNQSNWTSNWISNWISNWNKTKQNESNEINERRNYLGWMR